ncbi:MAG: hypothetical protein WAL40_02845, partial [Rhodoplanes sp.]
MHAVPVVAAPVAMPLALAHRVALEIFGGEKVASTSPTIARMTGHGSAVNPKTAPAGEIASRIAAASAPSEVATSAG